MHWGLTFLFHNQRAVTKGSHDAWFLGGWLIEGRIPPQRPPSFLAAMMMDEEPSCNARLVPHVCVYGSGCDCLRAADWRSTTFLSRAGPFLRPLKTRKGRSCHDDPTSVISQIQHSTKEYGVYRGGNKGLYVVARNFFLLLLDCSAWPYLCPG